MTGWYAIVEHADGRTTRWGGDSSSDNILADLTFSTSMPGGFRDATGTLFRSIAGDYPDLGLFDTITIYGPGGWVAWQGRMWQFPRSHGASSSITPGAVGWASHLRDDPSFTAIYVDRDSSRWQEMPFNRRKALVDAVPPQVIGKFSGRAELGGLGWEIAGDGTTVYPDESIHELWYKAPAGGAITIYYVGERVGAFTNFEAPTLYGADDDTGTSPISVALTFDNTLRAHSLASAKRYLFLRAYLNGGVATPAAGTWQQRISKIAVYGDHGVPLRTNGSDPVGVYASDVLAHVLAEAAPLLTLDIDATTYIINHLIFPDRVYAEDVVLAVNAFHQWDWGVWEDKTFRFSQSDSDALTWDARLSKGSFLDLAGDSAQDLYNGVMVEYTDPLGHQRIAGPPGGPFDVTDASLGDTSSTNPVNSHSIPARYKPLNPSMALTDADAIQYGAVTFASLQLPKRPGTLKLTGTVRHPSEGDVDAGRMRAGDYVRISDHPADLPRRIISTSYSVESAELSATLEATPMEIEKLIEARLGVGQVGI